MVDAITLYESAETAFDTNGLGSLPDATKCVVKEERNGAYELEMNYPITGRHYSDLKLRRLILVKPNPNDRPQPFRIYELSKPISGIVTVKAEHVRYDLAGYPTSNVVAGSASTALESMLTMCPVDCPFSMWSDRTQSGTFMIDTPCSILSMLGGNEGSVLDIFGGEYEYDRFEVKLHNARGKNRGVTIEYGKNMTDVKQEENCADVYTGVYPYWTGNDDSGYSDGGQILVELPEKIISVSGSFNYVRILTLDVSSEFENMPTADQLRKWTRSYISNNKVGVPKVNLTVSFVQLTQSDEYKDYNLLEEVNLCDTLTVHFRELGIDATAKVVKTTYDAISGKYESIELGDSRPSMTVAETIAATVKKTEEQITMSMVQMVAEHTSKLINGCFGGNVLFNYLPGSDIPYEILILDTDSIKTARRVWRWNSGGLAYSSHGYNGPWIVGLNSLGEINGKLIAANTIYGDAIISGTVDISALVGAENIVQRADISTIAGYVEDGQLWMQFDTRDNTGLWIGRIDSQFFVNITNEYMAFVQNDAYEAAVSIKESRDGYINAAWTADGRTKFLIKVNSAAGEHIFTYQQDVSYTGWIYNGSQVDLGDYGITYGGIVEDGDWIKVILSDDYRNGRVVAYISNNKLLIKDAHLQETLSFGKDFDPPEIMVRQGAARLTARFKEENGKTFLDKINRNSGVFDFVYEIDSLTWEDLEDQTWEDLGDQTWNNLGTGAWTLRGNIIGDGTNAALNREYGIVVSGIPNAGDIVRAKYDAIPQANFSFIPNENGSLKFKWVGPTETT